VLISGTTHFCEVFFTDVRVPKENLVGPLNGGWTIAKRLLQFERDSLAGNRADPPSLAEFAKRHVGTDAQGRIADPDLRHRLILNSMRSRAYSQTFHRAAVEAKCDPARAPALSALKNLGSEVSQERAELVVEILGQQGLGWEGEGYGTDELEATRTWLHSKAYSIYGGSYEIQNNITAKQVLGLLDHQ